MPADGLRDIVEIHDARVLDRIAARTTQAGITPTTGRRHAGQAASPTGTPSPRRRAARARRLVKSYAEMGAASTCSCTPPVRRPMWGAAQLRRVMSARDRVAGAMEARRADEAFRRAQRETAPMGLVRRARPDRG